MTLRLSVLLNTSIFSLGHRHKRKAKDVKENLVKPARRVVRGGQSDGGEYQR